MNKSKFIERLADAEHASWSRWMAYVFVRSQHQEDGSVLIPAELVEHWQRQVNTPYANLSEREKQSDRAEVAHIVPLIDTYVSWLREEAHDQTT